MNDLFCLFISFLILLVCILIGVAFLTLFERKILGYVQIRKGPNKVGFTGIVQPFSDAIKLFSKEQISPLMSNYISYYFSPVLNLFFSLILWLCLPFLSFFLHFSFSFLFFFCVSSLSVYSIMIAGWSSNSNYSMLGGMRCVAQTISYEVSLILILLSFLVMIGSVSIFELCLYQLNVWFLFISFPLCLIWFSSSLAETNRTPFDFAEGESELVSGFNIEYGSGGFALLFMAEYSSILFMSMMFVFIFFGGLFFSYLFFMFVLFISFMFIWTRGTLPRFRYDKLMYLAWKSFLPISLNFLMFYLGLKLFIFVQII
uniref:NADH-ubiquinone oxidoreductase chain 1 n=1 Tax=Emeia pseudosauteri TaxID=2592744 RepID=A0A5C0PXM9_9COLE|nr:NADH dehydrogenase subunit 1 [Emeia pseudosauteri]QEJ81590.1 NADH dehydrogenase subunit 1 [Emeia pseudosauteri]